MPFIYFTACVIICVGFILFKKYIDSKRNINVIEVPVVPIDLPPKYEDIIISPPPPRY
jgi:hypothetical protein